MECYIVTVLGNIFLFAAGTGEAATILTVLIEPSQEFVPWQNKTIETLGKYGTRKTRNITNDEDTEMTTKYTVVRETDILAFYNDFYAQSNDLMVFVDLRKEACPIDLFHDRLLGYVMMPANHCPVVRDAAAAAITVVDTWSFDLMTFMAQVTTSWSNSTFVDQIEASFALFFDESGEDHFLLPNRKITKKLIFQISLPLTNCSNSEQVTKLAAQTHTKDVIVIATTMCIYQLMSATSRLHLPSTRFRWLLYPTDGTDNMKWDGLAHFLDSVSPLILSERGRPLIPGQMFEVFTSHSQPEKGSIVFDIARMTARGSVHVANWSKETGISANEPLYPASFITSRLSVVVVVEPPFVFRNISESGVASYYGYSIDVLDEISKRNGFSYTVSECGSGGYGLLERGQWTGCIGNVVRGEADVILGALTVTAERDKVIDFTLPYYNFAGIQILMKKQVANINLFYYANVFTTQAWASLGAVVVATSVLLWAFEKLTSSDSGPANHSINAITNSTNSDPFATGGTPSVISKKETDNITTSAKSETRNDLRNNNMAAINNGKEPYEMNSSLERRKSCSLGLPTASCSLGESVWYIIAALTNAGGGDPPRSFSGRLLVAGFWFFAVIMMSTFTANLAAFLTVSRMGTTITSLSQLSGQSEVKFSVVNQSGVMEYFQRMANIEKYFYEGWKKITLDKPAEDSESSMAVWDYPLGNKYGEMWRAINQYGLLPSNEVGVERVTSENFALITETPVIQYYTARNCDLMVVGEQFSFRPYAIGLKERSPYTVKFSATILDLQKELQLSSLRLKWWSNSDASCPKETADKGLDLYSLSGTFILTGVGVVSGFLILGIEYAFTHLRQRHKRKKEYQLSLNT